MSNLSSNQRFDRDKVDLIIVYESNHGGPQILNFNRDTPNKTQSISALLDAAARKGLVFQTEVHDVFVTTTQTHKKVHYVKIHATDEFLTRRAEMVRLRVPLKEVDVAGSSKRSLGSVLLRSVALQVAEKDRLNPAYFYTVRFMRQLIPIYRAYGWILDVNGSLFSQSQRIYLVWSELESLTFQTLDEQTGKQKSRTLQDMLHSEAISSVFPVHDSDPRDDEELDHRQKVQYNARATLYKTWARFSQWRVLQPLDDIYSYFGSRATMYFALFGFYTKALCFPAVLGAIATICSVRKYLNPDLNEYCKEDSVGTYAICPACEIEGDYCYVEQLYKHCTYIKVTAMFDNALTIAYGFIVCLWSSVFLECWKRRQHELVNRWASGDVNSNETKVRSQFINKYMKDDTQSGGQMISLDGDVQSATRLWSLSATTGFGYIFKIIVSLALIICLVAFTIALATSSTFFRIFVKERLDRILYVRADLHLTHSLLEVVSPSLCASVIVGTVNASIMIALSAVYSWIARKLTNFECLRTEREYEKSFIYKIFVFQCINYFIGLFYTAFVKQWIGKAFELREQCPTNGCIADLSIQLLIIMTIKHAFGNIVKLITPVLKERTKRLNDNANNYKKNKKNSNEELKQCLNNQTQWQKDYELMDQEEPFLYSQYLDMCVQYAFVCLFATAFPPAALLALLNNIFQIRIDAKRYLLHFKRPIPMPARDIGPWFAILQYMQFVHFIYRPVRFEHIFDYYGTPEDDNANLTKMFTNYYGINCYTRDYIELNPSVDQPGQFQWELTRTWWHVFAAKLVFVIVFEKVVGWMQTLIAGLIPDIPDHVRLQKEREDYLEQQTLLQANQSASEN